MQRYHYDHADPGEREPLDYQHDANYDHPQQYQRQPEPYQSQMAHDGRPHREPHPQDNSYGAPQRTAGPGSHPDSSFGRLRAERRYSRDRSLSGGQTHYAGAVAAAASAAPGSQHYRDHEPTSPIASAPQPPPHRDADGRYWGRELGYPTPQANITPGADNFGESAAGGMAGIAYSVAERNARESGVEALRTAGHQSPPRQARLPQQPHQAYGQNPAAPAHGGYYGAQDYNQSPYAPQMGTYDRQSNSSITPLGAAAVAPAGRSPSRSPHSFGHPDGYSDDPYQGYSSRTADPHLGVVNPNDIEDDGDEGLEYRRPARTSMLSLHSDRASNTGRPPVGAAGAVAGGAAAGGVMGALGGMVGRQNGAAGATYNPVNNGGPYGSSYDLGAGAEKPSDWLSRQKTGRKKWKWCIIIAVVLLVAGGIAGGVVGGLMARKSSSGGQSAGDDNKNNGDLDINSPEIKSLMNNKDLHKVFPGIDYTPINTQYPDCIHNPPSQNNVTRDVAVLSQLTNTIRLYGTDCNQTQMVLHAISQLKMEDTVKVWLGVWQDGNTTTNTRQLDQMWDILDQYTAKPFKGLIVANEILFRQQMTAATLGTLLSSVRTKLASKGMSLPVGTSDLGNSWTWALAQESDFIMANIHPFFAGTNAKQAASWTNNFWQTNNGPFFKTDKSMNIISETGWPSQGGTDCGAGSGLTTCPDAAVAGIDQMNQFMADWVCASLANGTEYFWFEAFDEPWKVSFDEPGKEWEDHWGLMDVNRKLKPGVKIPDCGGKTV